MRVVAVVQARLSSNRLPGKVLRKLSHQALLSHLYEGLTHATLIDHIVVATSVDASDDPLAEYAQECGYDCFRGSLSDVAGRVLGAAVDASASVLVRICADSPLLDPRLVDEGVQLSLQSSADIVTNVHPRSYPLGQSVEVVRTNALARAVRLMSSDYEREHVTPYLYAHEDQFSVRGFSADPPRPDVRLCVDTPEDFARCEAIVAKLERPAWAIGWQGCVRAYDALEGDLG